MAARKSTISTIEAIWLAALVTVPSAVNPFAKVGMFDTEKGLLLRFWGLMAAFALLWRLLQQTLPTARRHAPSHAPATPSASSAPSTAPPPAPPRFPRASFWWLGGIAASAAISAIFALSPATAWYGGAGRGGGALTQLACIALCLAVATGCRNPTQVRRLLLAAVLGSILPTTVGWMQVAGLKPFVSGTLPENRPWGTFGNAIALGSYLVGVIPPTAYACWRARRWQRLAPGTLLLLQLLLLWYTAARGPLIALVGALAVAAVLAARRRGWRNSAIAGAIASIVMLVVFLGGVQLVARSEFVRQHSQTTGMLVRFNTVEVRVQLYRALTDRLLDHSPLETPVGQRDRRWRLRPWLGYGPDNLTEPLLSKIGPKFEIAESYDHIPDSTHSLPMDLLGGTGLLGLLMHIGFVLALLQLARRALALPADRATHRRAIISLASATLACSAAVIALWGSFSWAIGLFIGLYVGILLSIAVYVGHERRRRTPPNPTLSLAAALTAATTLLALWIESQFSIPMVSSLMLFYMGGGLLIALARMNTSAPSTPAAHPAPGLRTAVATAPAPLAKSTPPVQIAPAYPLPDSDERGPWCVSALIASFGMLLVSLLANRSSITAPEQVLFAAWRTEHLFWPALATVLALVWVINRRSLRPLVLLTVALALCIYAYAGTLATLRPPDLLSAHSFQLFAQHMGRAAALRLIPFSLLPLLIARRAWSTILPLAVITALGLAISMHWLWPEIRRDIEVSTIESGYRRGLPQAAMQYCDQVVSRSANSPHAAQHASRARAMAVRIARQAITDQQPQPAIDAFYDYALRWATTAVRLRPLYATHHAELAGIYNRLATLAPAPGRQRELALAADASYSAAIALAPGLTIHRVRLAGLRFTSLRDTAGARRELEQVLTLDPQNPVALSMFAQWTRRAGDTAQDPAARREAYREALLMSERCLLSPTLSANRIDTASVRRIRNELRQWFRENGGSVPTLPPPPARASYTPPKIPQPADRAVLGSIALRGVGALLLALVLTPVLRRIAPALGYVDAPAARKVHETPTPLLGGVAITLAALAAVFVLPDSLLDPPLRSAVIIAACLGLVGLWDDRKPLSWSVKLGAQIAAAVALHAAGIRVQLSWLPAWVNIALSLFWLIGITNAVNFLDNMNGLSAGLSAIAALAVMALGILNEGWGIAIVAAALAGACLGFLRYNHHWRASIFMGDAGSLFLGCMLASLGLLLRFPCNHNWVTWLCPVLLLAVPVFDMVHVCLARLRRGQNPLSTPGKDHTSHLLVRSGLPRHGAVMVIHAGVALCALAAGIVAYASVFVAYAIAGVIFGSAIYLLLYFELRFGAGGTD